MEESRERDQGIYFRLNPSAPLLVFATSTGEVAARVLLRYLLERRTGEPRLVGLHEIRQNNLIPSVVLGTQSELREIGATSPIAAKAFAPEEFMVVTSSQTEQKSVYILGSSTRGLVYGVGKWLRLLSYHSDGAVDVPVLLIRESPYHQFRASFTATHLGDRGYWRWSEDRHREYLEDLALWGANAGMMLPMQFGQRSKKVWEKGTPEAAEWEATRRFPIIARDLGLETAAYMGANDVFIEDFPSLKAAEGIDGDGIFISKEQCHVCPSEPSTRNVILRRREELFERLPYLDYLYVPTTDYGGCACSECRPYLTKTYLPLSRKISELMKKHHPDGKIIIGTQNCTRENVLEAFASYMRDTGREWVDFVCYACHSNSVSVPELLDILPPESRRILLYPYVTMIDNCGAIGAMPIAEQFAYSIKRRFDIGRLCIENGRWINVAKYWLDADLPVAFEPTTMYGAVCGAFTYSEGLHDDLNKAMWLSYDFSPLKRPEDVRFEYSRFYFGEDAAKDVAEAMSTMEKHTLLRCTVGGFCPPLASAGKLGEEMAEKEEELVHRAEAKLPYWAQKSWRFLMLRYRAGIDKIAFRSSRGEDCKAETERLTEIAREVQRSGHSMPQIDALLSANRQGGVAIF